MTDQELLKKFITETPEIEYLVEHYPLQAKYLWKLYKYYNKK